jgi:mono/diheme cytochrome c family protein
MPVNGTVPIGYEMPKAQPIGAPESHSVAGFSVGPDYIDTGKMGSNWGTGIPVPVTAELLQRGRERFNITCAMCHGATAAGNGIAKQHGLATVVTLQDDRIRKMADGEIFNTITNGKNTMMAYGPNIMVTDRWAIIAYLRALQRSQSAAIADVPPEHRADLEKPTENKPPEAKPAEAKPAENKSPTKPEVPKK